MAPKRKSNLGRMSSRAKKMKLVRSHETSDRRNKRLQSERQRIYESRNNESEENINERFTYYERTEFETNGKRRLNNKKNNKSITSFQSREWFSLLFY